MATNFFSTIWDVNICEATAIAKRRISYAFYTGGNYDIRQATAPVKRRINNICHVFGDNDT